jgi:hypothetical protein
MNQPFKQIEKLSSDLKAISTSGGSVTFGEERRYDEER